MKAIYPSLFFILMGVPTLATAAGSETADWFVQATILGSNRARMTLSFLDASGRQHVERATGEAVPALSVVRPGDQAILSYRPTAEARSSPGCASIGRNRPRRRQLRPLQTSRPW